LTVCAPLSVPMTPVNWRRHAKPWWTHRQRQIP